MLSYNIIKLKVLFLILFRLKEDLKYQLFFLLLDNYLFKLIKALFNPKKMLRIS